MDPDKRTGIHAPVMPLEDLETVLTNACRAYGAFVVTQTLAKVAQASSDTMLKYGNSEAVINRDSATLNQAVFDMASNHPLRAFTGV